MPVSNAAFGHPSGSYWPTFLRDRGIMQQYTVNVDGNSFCVDHELRIMK